MNSFELVTDRAELVERINERQVALVPTMGALHAGHLALVDLAARLAETVVVSIFVNPLQFGTTEDLERYPRTLEADRKALCGRGVGYLFAPNISQMYPNGSPEITVSAGRVGELFEGKARPGHFDGVLTVVAKLLGMIRPEMAVFGEKDAQQLYLVRQMVNDLDIPTRIVAAPTIRSSDGLALSSRNRYLSVKEGLAAPALYRALCAARNAATGGVLAALRAAHAVIDREELIRLDYLELVDSESFAPVPQEYHGQLRAIIAAWAGQTRLIDTLDFTVGNKAH